MALTKPQQHALDMIELLRGKEGYKVHHKVSDALLSKKLVERLNFDDMKGLIKYEHPSLEEKFVEYAIMKGFNDGYFVSQSLVTKDRYYEIIDWIIGEAKYTKHTTYSYRKRLKDESEKIQNADAIGNSTLYSFGIRIYLLNVKRSWIYHCVATSKNEAYEMAENSTSSVVGRMSVEWEEEYIHADFKENFGYSPTAQAVIKELSLKMEKPKLAIAKAEPVEEIKYEAELTLNTQKACAINYLQKGIDDAEKWGDGFSFHVETQKELSDYDFGKVVIQSSNGFLHELILRMIEAGDCEIINYRQLERQ